MKGQKQYVVESVQALIPNFRVGRDVALVMLTKDQLEYVKSMVGAAMISGDVDYGKDRTKSTEVYAYARSMVMNHLKKAKELNGGVTYGKTPSQIEEEKTTKSLSAFNTDIMPEDLREFVKTLV